MTLQQGLSFLIIGIMLALFVWDRLRYDLVALLVLFIALIFGILPLNKAFSGFSHSLLPLIASVLVISAAIDKSGVIDAILRPLRSAMRFPDLQVGVLVATVTFLSAVIKNVGALSIFLPIAVQMARRNNRSPSEVLMPMSFGSLIGGMMTLIGTSPNLIASTLRQEALGRPYSMFDFLPVGLGISMLGILYLSFGWRLIPRGRTGAGSSGVRFSIEGYVSEATIPATSQMVGKTVGDLEELSDGDVIVNAIVREENRRYIPAGNWTLYAGDILVLQSDPHALEKLVKAAGLELIGSKTIPGEHSKSPDIATIEAVIAANSPMIGASPSTLRLRARYEVNLLALSRAGQRIAVRLGSLAFREGDVVVLQGRSEAMPEVLTSLGCLPLAERNLQLGRPRKVFLPLAILAIVVALAATEVVPAAVVFTGGALLIGLFRILTLKEIYDSIEWPVLILLGALIPVGEAIRDTGASGLIAGWFSGLSSVLPVSGMLAVILILTMMVTPLLHHAAAMIVMGPIAVSLAATLGLNVDPFLMAVAVGASCDFLSPIGHQNNALVMGPGGYRFRDYWRLGLPLSILVVVLGTPLILLVWPLH